MRHPAATRLPPRKHVLHHAHTTPAEGAACNEHAAKAPHLACRIHSARYFSSTCPRRNNDAAGPLGHLLRLLMRHTCNATATPKHVLHHAHTTPMKTLLVMHTTTLAYVGIHHGLRHRHNNGHARAIMLPNRTSFINTTYNLSRN
jgi:hypothetical protein